MRTINGIKVGPYYFEEVTDHGFTSSTDGTLWRFTIEGSRASNELYPTLDHAMVAAVGERHTGQRGAAGTAVGTAADWFMKMIGVEES